MKPRFHSAVSSLALSTALAIGMAFGLGTNAAAVFDPEPERLWQRLTGR